MAQVTHGSFGHKKRAELGAILLHAVQTKRTSCLHRLAEDRNQAIRFGNFLANPAVGPHEMLVTAGRQTNEHGAGRHILAVMDTTDVPFPTQSAGERGFGIGSDGTRPGPKTRHLGLLRLEPMLEGWRMADRSVEARLPQGKSGGACARPQASPLASNPPRQKTGDLCDSVGPGVCANDVRQNG